MNILWSILLELLFHKGELLTATSLLWEMIYLAPFTIWNPDPYFIRSPIAIRWYGLTWGLTVLLGYLVGLFLFRRRAYPERDLVTLVQYIFLGGLLGARLGQILFYDLSYYIENPNAILRIWEGGLSSHGGAIGVLLASWLYCRRYPRPTVLQLLDILAIIIPLGGAWIRLGNLMNSELVGKVTTVPWAFLFVQVDMQARHPSVLYEAILAFGLFAGLLMLYLRYPNWPAGRITALFFTVGFALRAFLEFFKEDAYTTQLLSIPIIIGGIILWIYSGKKQDRVNIT